MMTKTYILTSKDISDYSMIDYLKDGFFRRHY